MRADAQTVLVADIGGTNARFAIARRAGDGSVRLGARRAYANQDFAGPAAVIAEYLRDAGAAPQAAAFAIAGPVRGGAGSLTNHGWAFSTDALRAASGAGTAVLLNDFAAAAMSLPYLPADALAPLGGPDIAPGMWASPELRVSALGPGTGLGHAILVRDRGALRALDTEGGHAGFAPWDEETWAVCAAVTARHGRCSLEHLLSGPGLATLYAVLAGDAAAAPAPSEIGPRAAAGDATAARTLDLFCRILGSAAGDLALSGGARCVFVLGGVAQALAAHLREGGFRARFDAKGDFADYMRAIPTVLARDRSAGLVGAAASVFPDAVSIRLEEE